MRIMFSLALKIGLFVFSPMSASACFGAENYAYSPAEQLSRSTEVYVATFTGYEALELGDMANLPNLPAETAASLGLRKAAFDVQQTIKGQQSKTVTLSGVVSRSAISSPQITHDSLEFWYAGRANGEQHSTCGYRFTLQIGHDYLVSKREETLSIYSAEPILEKSDFYYLLSKRLLSSKEIMRELLLGNVFLLGRCDAPNANEVLEIIRSANSSICNESAMPLAAIFERYDNSDRFFLEVFESRKTWRGSVKLHRPQIVFDGDARSKLPSSIILKEADVNWEDTVRIE